MPHTTLSIISDDTIIGVIDANAYNQLRVYKEQWTWKAINNLLLDKLNHHALLFSTAWEEEWKLDVYINKVCTISYHRKFEQEIEVTDNKLYLCTWSYIISTLQFEDASLPDSTNEDLYINIPNGKYNVIVKELFDYQDEDYTPGETESYAMEFHSIDDFENSNLGQIYWTEAFPNDDSIMIDNSSNDFDELIDKMIQYSKIS